MEKLEIKEKMQGFIDELEGIIVKYCKLKTELHDLAEWVYEECTELENDMIIAEDKLMHIIEHKIKRLAEKHGLKIHGEVFTQLGEYRNYVTILVCSIQANGKLIYVFAVLREHETEDTYNLELDSLYYTVK